MKEYDLKLDNLKWKMLLHKGKVYEPEEMLKSNKFYEPKIMKTCFKLLDNKTTFVDIGANMGVFSFPASLICGYVIAIEPDKDRCDWLEENIVLNGLNNMIVLPLALSDINGEGYMGCNMSTDVSGKMFRFSKNKKYTNSKKIRTKILDDVLLSKEKYVVKIDVEGSEYLVLKGMERVIQDNPDIKIICEVHEEMMKDIFNVTLDKFYKLLDKLNLKKTEINDVGLHYLLEVK